MNESAFPDSKCSWLKICSIVIRKQQVIEDALPWITWLARRINKPSDMDIQDVVAYGYEGLLGALDKFDPFRGVQFTTYAESRIVGAMKDAVRTEWGPINFRRYDAKDVVMLAMPEDVIDLRSDEVDRKILIGELAEMVTTLPTQERNVIEFIFFSGYTQRAVSRFMGFRHEWVSIVKYRGLKRLDLRLKQLAKP